ILQAFNSGQLDAQTAMERLLISRSRLYQLRQQWLRQKAGFSTDCSGGDHRPAWPTEAHQFLEQILPHSQPLNFALLADELARRFGFQRSRASVAAYVRAHFPRLAAPLQPGPKPRRRWESSSLGELWQHDSSPHAWWPAAAYPTLILTLDDHSRKILGGTFVPSDTTWSHFTHLRPLLESFGLPACLYTDGLSLFGHRTPADRLDTHSQFQRAFCALGVHHRVAPDAQAKGKIERRFLIFQKRLVTLLAFEKITDYPQANAFLQTQLAWHNQNTRCRTTQLTPNQAWEKAHSQRHSKLRPIPPTPLLDLHLAIHLQRRLNTDHTIDFLGRSWPITPTSKKSVTLIHHPEERFWVVDRPVDPKHPRWPTVLGHFRL
ncbi:MAG TPA: hypothetical protein DCE44_10715, partial [Verrucomicrobiales bacterium]|nr:hypothetical protein [Verrucomicrobiales bacterium]